MELIDGAGQPTNVIEWSSSHEREAAMYLIRDVMYCKPGQVRPMVQKSLNMRKLGQKMGLGAMRVMTDAAGDFWTVVMEIEAESIDKFEELVRKSAEDKEFQEVMKGVSRPRRPRTAGDLPDRGLIRRFQGSVRIHRFIGRSDASNRSSGLTPSSLRADSWRHASPHERRELPEVGEVDVRDRPELVAVAGPAQDVIAVPRELRFRGLTRRTAQARRKD